MMSTYTAESPLLNSRGEMQGPILRRLADQKRWAIQRALVLRGSRGSEPRVEHRTRPVIYGDALQFLDVDGEIRGCRQRSRHSRIKWGELWMDRGR